MSDIPWVLRRARPSDADGFVRMMQEPAVYSQLLQLPFPDAETWRARLASPPRWNATAEAGPPVG